MLTKTFYQPLAPLLIAAVAGILIDRLFALPLLIWLLLALTTLAIWFYWRQTAFIVIACSAFFGSWHHNHWYLFAENDIGNYAPPEGQPAALIGTVVQMPRYFSKPLPFPGQIFEPSERTMFTLRAEQLRDGNDWIPVVGNILITVYDDGRPFRTGNRLQLFGELSKPPIPHNPGGFDYSTYLRGQRIKAVFRCPDNSAITLLDRNPSLFSFIAVGRWLESVRRSGLNNLELHLSEKTLPIAAAMIFGLRESVDEDVQQSMIDTGTMHLLAISGLHVTLIVGIGAVFLRLLKCSLKTTAIAMIVFVLFYLMLTDVRTPAIRATALTCSAAVALYLMRIPSAKNILCASALVILLIKPSELFQFGAQLSFIAVGSFLWLPKYVKLKAMLLKPLPGDENYLRVYSIEYVEAILPRWFRLATKSLRLSIETFLISLTIWLFTMPILMYHINIFTPIAILVNPLTWIPLTLAMSFGFLTSMLGHIPFAGTFLGAGADWAFWFLIEMIVWFQNLGGHYWVAGPPNWWVFGFYAVFAFYTFLPVRRPHWLVLLSALLVWVLVGLGAGFYKNYERLRNDRLTLTVLSVGHGNCVLITLPDKRTIVCDAGNLISPKHAADAMSKALWRQGKTHIDAVLISHPDTDHFNAIPILLDRFSVGVFLISPYFSEEQTNGASPWQLLRQNIEERKIPLRILGKTDDLAEWGLANSMILHPPKDDFAESDNSNATSLVLRIEHRNIGILLPGDLDGRDTAPFLLKEPIPTEILMIPHHGGRSTQTDKLLEWASPRILIFSHGKRTHNPGLLEFRRQQGYDVRSTFLEGAIIIDIGQ